MMARYYEDLTIGLRYELGSYTFTKENIRSFSSRFAPVPFHSSAEVAEQGLFGSIAAVGFHICCAWMPCFLKTLEQHQTQRLNAGEILPEIGPGAGLKNIRWHIPVHAGDVVSYSVEVKALRDLKSKPGWGLVTVFSQGHNQRGACVVSFESSMLTAMRAAMFASNAST